MVADGVAIFCRSTATLQATLSLMVCAIPPPQTTTHMCLLGCIILQVDSDSWGNVEPDGLSKVPPTRKGLMGLLGRLGGVMGAVGVVPAGARDGVMLKSCLCVCVEGGAW
jgi:hypothetical protein